MLKHSLSDFVSLPLPLNLLLHLQVIACDINKEIYRMLFKCPRACTKYNLYAYMQVTYPFGIVYPSLYIAKVHSFFESFPVSWSITCLLKFDSGLIYVFLQLKSLYRKLGLNERQTTYTTQLLTKGRPKSISTLQPVKGVKP